MLLAAAALLVAVPASAQAITVTATAAPTDTTAGAHSDFNVEMNFSGGQVHDLTVGLPPGLVGDPTATPLCTVAQLNSASHCPDQTQVGEVTAVANILSLPLPIEVPGRLFNLEPQPGEPARFGIVLTPPLLPAIVLQSAVNLRSDFGLDSVINDIPNTSIVDGDTTIVSQELTLYGSRPWMNKPFMRNPTSCDTKTTTISATPYSGADGSAQASFTPTNCGTVPFTPGFAATVGGPGQTTNGVPTTATTSILQDLGEAGLRKAVVKVPPDLNPNASIFFGQPCDQASFIAGTCPPNTVVGSASAASPLLSQPLSGPVSLVSSGGQFPNLGLDLRGQLHLLLQGSIDIAGGNTVTFGDVPPGLPDIPIADFRLTFTPSPGLLGTSRDLCVGPPPIFHADFTGYNGATTSVDSPATVEGCGPVKKCKKAKKKKGKKKKQRAAESKKKKDKKKKGKKKCKKKKKKKGKKKR